MQDAILRNFRKVVTPQFISDTAHKVKFNYRSTSQVSGINFTKMLIMQIGSGQEMNYSNLNANLSKINPRVHISNQALSEYFYREASVSLVKTLYEKVFSFQKDALLKQYKKNIDQKVLDLFNRVFIEDSTFCTLNKNLEYRYKGSGGGASPSSLKIDLIHELKTGATAKLTISSGNVPDGSFSGLILEELQADDLILRDLGYFKLSEMEKISNNGSYFISRFKYKVNVYLNRESSSSIDIGRYLAKRYNDFPTEIVDIFVYLGDAKHELRLVAYKVPLEIANERRRKAKRTASDRGRTISEGLLNLCDYVILLTNIPANKIQAKIIGTIYRIRWSIELIFKTWKSQLNLQLNLKGYKATRIECFVYAILISCLLMTIIHGWLKKMIDPIGKEISLDKLSKWLVARNGYYQLFQGNISKLGNELVDGLRTLRMQKRKRKTTLERVACMEAYSEKYAINTF